MNSVINVINPSKRCVPEFARFIVTDARFARNESLKIYNLLVSMKRCIVGNCMEIAKLSNYCLENIFVLDDIIMIVARGAINSV